MSLTEPTADKPEESVTSSIDYAGLLEQAQTEEALYPSADRAKHIGHEPMPHERLRVTSDQQKEYQSLLAQATKELDTNNTPVDIKEGRGVFERTQASIEIFRDELLPTLGLNDRLKQVLLEITDEILHGDIGILVDNQSLSRFSNLVLREGIIRYDPEGQAVMEMGVDMVNVKTEWLSQAAERAGVSLTDEQAADLGFNWLVWHELGHGVQTAYTRTAEPARTNPSYPYTAYLPVDVLEHGVSEGYFPPENKISFYNKTIDSERFAEGLSQMLVATYAREHLGLSESDALRLREALTPPERIEDVATARDIALSHVVANNGDFTSVGLGNELRAKNVTINSIGYGSPHAPEKIREIIAAANRLSGLPWRERVAK